MCLKTIIPAVLILPCLIFSACQSEDTIERDYPIVMTLAADHIASNSARLNASIIYGSVESITEYGFVWGNSFVLNVGDSEKVFVSGRPSSGSYSCDIPDGLEKKQKYFVRAYIQSGELIVYGNLVTFTTSDISFIPGNSVQSGRP